uniref:PX domain-containing protein n=1 Tax=Hanusia phi TaxID=3032 RepID=A0A7S0EBX0_9CRYP
MRNPDLRKEDAKPQFRDEDFDFGSKKKQMVGSQGQIIELDGQDDSKSEAPKQFKAQIAGTEQRPGKWMMEMLATEYTVYKFTICFGKHKWEISKRFSDFDKLDNRLNDKFGLPPVGLPPKKWFGLTDPELILERHKILLTYINDCLKRPVLLHSRELQQFTDMPPEVVDIVTKGK